MAARDALNPRQFMYHHSPPENRESINRHGLLPGQEEVGGGANKPRGVFMSPTMDAAGEDIAFPGRRSNDRWRVDVTGLKLDYDPAGSGIDKYSPHKISRKRIQMAGAANVERWNEKPKGLKVRH